mmetsp:Transcript_34526/g.48134  ORF Transcript_34526/g.48134 Transcript_34526/m.48134 type:complete len:113 (-) Transcript_34526:282-620(-)
MGASQCYKIDFLNWMARLYNRGVCGILAEEMGLGNDGAGDISMVGYLSQYTNQKQACILSSLRNRPWRVGRGEFHKWLPGVRVVKILGNRTERAEALQSLSPQTFDVLTHEL